MGVATADPGASGNLNGLGRAVIMLGAPGAGKGTQAQRIAQKYGLPHLSTGDMFRDNIRRDTELGQRAKPIMARGELVPDEIVLGMVKDRITQADCAKGFLFDGFPRTLDQAEGLGRIIQERKFGLTTVVHLIVPLNMLMRRLTGRRICKASGHIYNIYDRPPKQEGICDEDGSELIHRTDDTESVIGERLQAYEQLTEPLVKYYTEHGLLKSVDAVGDADAVYQSIVKILDERK